MKMAAMEEDDFELEIDADDDIILDESFEEQSTDIRIPISRIKTEVEEPTEPIVHPRVECLKKNKNFREPRRGPQGHGGVGRVSNLITSGSATTTSQEDHEDIPNRAAVSSTPDEDVNLSLDEVIEKRQIAPPPEFKVPAPPRQNRNVNQENMDSNQNTGMRLSGRNLLQHRQINASSGRISAPSSVRSSDTDLSRTVKLTPVSGIRLLANLGMVVVLEVRELPVDCEDEQYYHKRRWKACYYDGRVGKSLTGIAEAPRKSLAKEAAALDFLEKLRVGRPDLSPTLRTYEIPYGCRVPPSVLGHLESLVSSLGLGEVRYKQELIQVRGRDKYQYTITIGDAQYKQSSYEMKYARYCAAKLAYDDLKCGKGEFRLDNYFCGDECMEDSKHELIETEELHVCKATLPQVPNPKRKMETMYGPATLQPKRFKTVVEPTVPKVVSNLREQHQERRQQGTSRDSVCGSVAASIISIL